MSEEQRRTGSAEADENDVGSMAEEAVKLFAAIHDWARESSGAEPGAAGEGMVQGLLSAGGGHVGHDQDCRYCPVCIAINRVRQTSPEVREHLAAALDSLARAATAALRSEDAACSDQEARSPTKVDLDE